MPQALVQEEEKVTEAIAIQKDHRDDYIQASDFLRSQIKKTTLSECEVNPDSIFLKFKVSKDQFEAE